MKKLFLILLLFFTTFSFSQILESEALINFYPKFTNHDPNFVRTDTLSFYQQKDKWQQIIDNYWGTGLSLIKKQKVFNHFANNVENVFPCFNELPLNWDSLRSHYYSQITSSTSKGRFSAIMSQLAWKLNDLHTRAWDINIVRITPLNPGTPLLEISYPFGSHFGAGLTPLPDSTLLVYKVVKNHPLNLEPGDIVLGYEDVPWKKIIFELLEAEIPMGAVIGSSPSSRIHTLLEAAGNNWHLFNTMDVIKYQTGDTVHLSTDAMLSLSGAENFYFNEQLPIAGVPMPNYDYTRGVSGGVTYGIVEGTNIGYIYVCKHTYSGLNGDFEKAVLALLHTDGLILDFRYNSGGRVAYSLQEGFSILADFDTYTLDKYVRCSSSNLFSLCQKDSIPETSWYINGDTATAYNKPIAVLVGPSCVSMGEITAYRFKFLPTTRFFGKSTFGGFSNYRDFSLNGFELRIPTYTIVEYNNPEELLVRKEFPVDEYVWLEKDDVANGDDTVVKKALEWINNVVSVEKTATKTLFEDFILSQNYPNPFNPSTVIKYQIPNYKSQINSNSSNQPISQSSSRLVTVQLIIYDILGREAATLVNQKQKPGYYEVNWNAASHPSGVYLYRFTAGDYVKTKKMILLR